MVLFHVLRCQMSNSLIKLSLAIAAGLVIGGVAYRTITYLWDWYGWQTCLGWAVPPVIGAILIWKQRAILSSRKKAAEVLKEHPMLILTGLVFGFYVLLKVL